VFLLLQLGLVASAGPRRLEDCIQPEDIASALVKLRERAWAVWTPQELVKVWPRSLTPLDCQSSQGSCVLLGHKGRSGEGSCECCETFDFDLEAKESGKAQQRLSAIMIYYSTDRYADVLSAARLLVKTMGLPDTEGPIAQDQPPPKPLKQSFEWRDTALQKHMVLDLEISHDKVWTAYVRVGWHPEI